MTHCNCEIHRVMHVLDLMAKLFTKMEATMADLSGIKQVVVDLNASVDAVSAKIDALKAQIGSDQSDEVAAIKTDFDALKARIDALAAA